MAEVSAAIPVLANLFPSGTYLMEDFYFAGGLPALLAELRGPSRPRRRDRRGPDARRDHRGRRMLDDDVIRAVDNPVGAAVARAHAGAAEGQSRAGRRGDQVVGRRSRSSCGTTGPALVFDEPGRACARGSTIPTSTSPRTPCSSCAMPARSARRACRNGATCRSRRSSSDAGVTRHGADLRRRG